MDIHLGQTQSLKQTQRLIMSPRMQQAINLLQLPIQELSILIEQEIAKNPFLELSDDSTEEYDDNFSGLEVEEFDAPSDQGEFSELYLESNDFDVFKQIDADFAEALTDNDPSTQNRDLEAEESHNFYLNSISLSDSVFEQLLRQARINFRFPWELKAAEAIIGSLDDRGFLESDLEELCILYDLPIELLEVILKRIHLFDPPGVGARNVQETLLIQLQAAGKADSTAFKIVDQCYYEMIHNQIPAIHKTLGISVKDILRSIKEEIAILNLRPAITHNHDATSYIIPDARIYVSHGIVEVELNEDSLPDIRVNNRYLTAYYSPDSNEELRNYLKERLSSGKWLMRNLLQRNETLRRILLLLVKKQEKHFLDTFSELAPLTMKVLAAELGLHESTIARAVSNKFIDTPNGILPLRSFFTNAYSTENGEDISSLSVKNVILELIKSENPKSPYSDEKLSQILQKKGVTCARRTIAKYRQELNLGNASQRKRYQ